MTKHGVDASEDRDGVDAVAEQDLEPKGPRMLMMMMMIMMMMLMLLLMMMIMMMMMMTQA